MAKKTTNKCVHMTPSEDAYVVQLAEASGRKASQIIHDCITVAAFQVPEFEKRLAESRLAYAASLVTDSIQTVDFMNPERSESANDESRHTRFSRLMDSAQRPEVLHG